MKCKKRKQEKKTRKTRKTRGHILYHDVFRLNPSPSRSAGEGYEVLHKHIMGFIAATQALTHATISTDFDDGLSFRQQTHCGLACTGKHGLQAAVGDIAACHP